jgi:hypothetical protein
MDKRQFDYPQCFSKAPVRQLLLKLIQQTSNFRSGSVSYKSSITESGRETSWQSEVPTPIFGLKTIFSPFTQQSTISTTEGRLRQREIIKRSIKQDRTRHCLEIKHSKEFLPNIVRPTDFLNQLGPRKRHEANRMVTENPSRETMGKESYVRLP